MAAITEDYVSFETAKLLKEKGFEERVMHYYFTQITHVGFKDYPTGVLYTDSYPQNQNNYNNKVAAPTLQMAMKWLREVHNIFIEPTVGETNGKTWYDFDIIPINEREIAWNHYDNLPVIECNSYEEACEVAIKYCLENLI